MEDSSKPRSRPSRRRNKFTVEKRKQTKGSKTMNKETQAIRNDMGQLADDARALMTATADVAGDKVSEARKRLAAALERGKEVYGRVKEKAVEGAKVADEAVHEHPYQAIAIGVGVGAVLGYLIARRGSRNGD
jgi:ElaB/YqjD/DUF883 family membrane-anchored ribosome-binding protein